MKVTTPMQYNNDVTDASALQEMAAAKTKGRSKWRFRGSGNSKGFKKNDTPVESLMRATPLVS
jgi:hypothetical protein